MTKRLGFSAAQATLDYIRNNADRLFVTTTAPSTYSAASNQPQKIVSANVTAADWTVTTLSASPALTFATRTLTVEGSGSASHAVWARASGSTILAVTDVCGTRILNSGATVNLGSWTTIVQTGVSSPPITAPTQTANYTADTTTKFPNPANGWMIAIEPPYAGPIPNGTPHSPAAPLTQAILGRNRTGFIEFSGQQTEIPFTTLLDYRFLLCSSGDTQGWNERDLRQVNIDRLAADLAQIRTAGMKVWLTIGYSWAFPDSWDTTEFYWKRHLDQYKATLLANADIIAYLFITPFGSTMEGNDGGGGSDGVFHVLENGYPGGWQMLSPSGKRIGQYFLSQLPGIRMDVRYPRFKWDLLGIGSGNAVTAANAYDGSDASRIGYASQGYMGDSNDFAMYTQTGEKTYAFADTIYNHFHGEVSTSNSYNETDGRPQSHAALCHCSHINRNQGDGEGAYQAWITNNDTDDMIRRLGYRIRLTQGTYPTLISRGQTLQATLTWTNDGFASHHLPCGIKLILKSRVGGPNFAISYSDGFGNRRTMPIPGETKSFTISGALPLSLAAGTYDLFLHLHDPNAALETRSDYAVRLANTGVWDSQTGYNNLNAAVSVI